jgi:GNAT superfamily N-acetyltransferase
VPDLLEIRRIGGRDPVAARLLAAMEGWVGENFGPVAPGLTSVVDAAEMEPPGGQYVAIWAGGEPIAGGGVRRLDDRAAEVKRMWVEPSHRRGGLGHRLLCELEAAARDLGFTHVRLDTSETLAGFYLGAGYAPIPDYNGNPYARFWGEKAL